MSGTVYKRCTKCGNRIKERTCGKCGLVGRFNWALRAYVGPVHPRDDPQGAQ